MRFGYILLAVLVAGLASTPPAGADTWPYGSIIPDAVPISPDGDLPCRIVINTASGPVNGAYVEVEFSGEAAGLIAWSDPVPPGADAPVELGQYGGPVFAGSTDANGEIIFHIAGGGCVAEKVGTVDPYIVQIRADNILLAEPVVNSPDVVDTDGALPEELGAAICDPVTSTTSVGLADAIFHTAPIKQGLVEICTDFTNDGNPAAGLGDASILTPYVRGGVSWSCVYTGP